MVNKIVFRQLLTKIGWLSLGLTISMAAVACDSIANLAGLTKTGVVTARRAQIRSTVAVVAADLLEVKRGDSLEIIDEAEVGEGRLKELWLNVRVENDEKTEGWIEARYVLQSKLLEESRKVAAEDKELPAQAAGQLRAPSNLRLKADLNDKDNILVKLESGASFEIVGWKRVPKADTESDKDDSPKTDANANQNGAKPTKREKQAEEKQTLDDKYDTWYKVRLAPSLSPAPAGWIFGRQVELQVPSDIIFYRTGREFVAWNRLDGEGGVRDIEVSKDKDAAKEVKPGSWVVLERSQQASGEAEEPDFDRILVLGYDKVNQEHYKVYRSGNVKGFLPLRTNGTGDSRVFSVKLKAADGQIKEFQFKVFKTATGSLKIEVPPDIPKDDKSEL